MYDSCLFLFLIGIFFFLRVLIWNGGVSFVNKNAKSLLKKEEK